jgi:uncharacterized protein (DUF433 family)
MREVTAGTDILRRITSDASDASIFGGKSIIRGHRLAEEHVLSMLAAGDMTSELMEAYPFLEPDDVRACLLYAYKLVAHERTDPFPTESAA